MMWNQDPLHLLLLFPHKTVKRIYTNQEDLLNFYYTFWNVKKTKPKKTPYYKDD